MKKPLFSILLILASLSFAAAQTTTGRLSGTVSSADGVLPGVTVSVTDDTTGREQTVVTNESGTYVFPQLEFGTYTVRISATGFKAFVAEQVKIDVGRTNSLDPILEVGNVQETVTVTAGADVVTATTAQISNTISPQQILSLPLVARNPLDLTRLQPGVASNSAQATTINGLRTTFTNITRDGINIQDTFIRTNATDFAPGRPSVDDTAEFTVTTSNAEADQGYGGAQIRLVTPRGTKDFHGALFAYNRNSEFGANSFFRNRAGTPRPFRNRNQFGGKVSGPLPLLNFGEGGPSVIKDKGFFFFAYEGIRDPLGGNFNRTILTPSARNGVFQFNRTNSAAFTNPFVSCPSATIGALCTVTDIIGFARSVGLNVPAGINPVVAANILSQIPAQGNTTGGDGLNTTGFTLNRLQTQNRDQYSSRVDVDFNERHSLLGIYNYNNESNLRPDADTTLFTATPEVLQSSINKQFTMAFRSILSSNFVNEARGGIFTSEVPFNRTDAVPNFFTSSPLVPFPAANSSFVTVPENTFLFQGRNTKNINFQDNADLVLGNHTIRFGGQLQFFKVNASNDVSTVPTVSLGGTGAAVFTNTGTGATNFANVGGISNTQLTTANALLALLTGNFSSVTQSFNVADINSGFVRGATAFTPFRYENHSLYVSDRWAVNNDLTLTLGLRYELFPALRLTNGVALEPVISDPENIAAAVLNRNGTLQPIGGNAGRKDAYYKTDKNNFAPNFGIAYAPKFESGLGRYLLGENKTVFRAGYSHVYGNDSIVTSINNAAIGNAGLGRTALTASNLTGQFLGTSTVPTIPVPATPVFPRTYLQNNAAGIGNFFGTVFAIDPKLETPMVEQYSVGVQREFFGNMAFEVRYVGSRSKNLARGIDVNQVDIFNNGFLNDFLRAQNNLRLTGDPFCAAAGCQSLTIFQQTAGALGRLGVAPTTAATPAGTLARANFLNALNNGTPADLALLFINNATNLNNQPSSANPNGTPFVNFLANPAAGAIDVFLNGARYNYNSLQVELRRRFSDGLYFQANYTFSKNLTNAIGTSQQLFEPLLDNNNPDLEWQRADFDQTHVFNFNGIYQLPFGNGKPFLNQGGAIDRIFGGFELSGLFQITSGAPITLVDTRGTLNRSGRSTRQTPFSTLTNDEIRALAGTFVGSSVAGDNNVYFINPNILSIARNANGTYSSTASNGYSLTGAGTFPGQAFFNVQPGQTGNVARAIFDGPNYYNVNLALLKNIRFTESMRLQLRAEAFNVFNTTNFAITANQLSNINSQTFGQFTTTFVPRELQFAVRFEF